MLDDKELLEQYYTFLINNRRKKTADIYLFLLNHYVTYLHKINKTLHTAKAQEIQSYIATRTWSNTAKVMFITIVKTFYSKYYLNKIDIGVTTDELRIRLQRENDVREISQYPLPHKETTDKTKALDLSSVKTFLNYAKKESVVEYCIIWCLFYFGLRKSELMNLSPTQDINWKDNYIIIQAEKSKTHSRRILYFNDYTKQCLIQILKSVGSKDVLIPKDDTYINKIFEKYNRAVGRHLFPHMARHTWISEMQKSLHGKIDIDVVSVVKILAGHTSKDMTMRYTNYEPYLKKAMTYYHYLV